MCVRVRFGPLMDQLFALQAAAVVADSIHLSAFLSRVHIGGGNSTGGHSHSHPAAAAAVVMAHA